MGKVLFFFHSAMFLLFWDTLLMHLEGFQRDAFLIHSLSFLFYCLFTAVLYCKHAERLDFFFSSAFSLIFFSDMQPLKSWRNVFHV